MLHARSESPATTVKNKMMFIAIVKLFVLVFISGVSSNIGYFWHITDIHWDSTYMQEGRSCQGAVEDQDSVGSHGIFGDYNCDSPWRLVYSMVEGIRDLKSDPDFVIWTGDTVPDFNEEYLKLNVIDNILGNVTYLIKETISGIPVFPTMGHRDFSFTVQLPVYNDTFEKWKSWISDLNAKTFTKGGYYKMKTKFGLLVVGLNTNLYQKGHKQASDELDPSGQFKWLEQTLISARITEEKVLITGHIPPGVNPVNGEPWMQEQYNARLNRIVKANSDVITGMLFGHEHSDNLRVYHNEKGKGIVSQFVAPSVTPRRNRVSNLTSSAHNPGMRLYKYDRLTGVILDYTQYYIDLPQANTENVATWEIEYNATSAYGIPNLLPSSMSKLVDVMRNKSSLEFRQFFKFWTVNVSETDMDVCDERCHAKFYCNYKFQNYDENLDCYDRYFSPLPVNSQGTSVLDSYCVLILSATVWTYFGFNLGFSFSVMQL